MPVTIKAVTQGYYGQGDEGGETEVSIYFNKTSKAIEIQVNVADFSLDIDKADLLEALRITGAFAEESPV